jgi:serine/threonine protein kinase
VVIYRLVASLISKVIPQRVEEYVNSLLAFTFMDACVAGIHNVRILGVVENQGDKFVVSEDLGRNTLEEMLLDTKDRLPRQTLLQAAFCVASALKVFGQLNTPHQGVTLDNIYFDGKKWILGPPRLFQEPEIYTVDERMLDYKAPEVTDSGSGCAVAADVWSFGSLVSHMYYQNKPKTKQSMSFANIGSLLLGVACEKDQKSGGACQKDCEDPVLSKCSSQGAEVDVPEAAILELVNLCTNKKPESRPPLTSLFESPVACDHSRYSLLNAARSSTRTAYRTKPAFRWSLTRSSDWS